MPVTSKSAEHRAVSEIVPDKSSSIILNPDPTSLTTAQLFREIQWTRELADSNTAVLFTRIDAMQKAVELIQANADKSPTIAEMYARFDERFKSVDVQFNQRDILTKELSLATKVAVDAALQAAEKAVGKQQESNAEAIKKSEAGTKEQISQLMVTIQTSIKSIDDRFTQQSTFQQATADATNEKFTAVKDLISANATSMKDLSVANAARITAVESRAVGLDRAEKRQGDQWALVFGGLGAVLGVAGFVVALIVMMQRVK